MIRPRSAGSFFAFAGKTLDFDLGIDRIRGDLRQVGIRIGRVEVAAVEVDAEPRRRLAPLTIFSMLSAVAVMPP